MTKCQIIKWEKSTVWFYDLKIIEKKIWLKLCNRFELKFFVHQNENILTPLDGFQLFGTF